MVSRIIYIMHAEADMSLVNAGGAEAFTVAGVNMDSLKTRSERICNEMVQSLADFLDFEFC